MYKNTDGTGTGTFLVPIPVPSVLLKIYTEVPVPRYFLNLIRYFFSVLLEVLVCYIKKLFTNLPLQSYLKLNQNFGAKQHYQNLGAELALW